MKTAYEIAWSLLKERNRLAWLTNGDIARLTGLDIQVMEKLSRKEELARIISLNGLPLTREVMGEIEEERPHYRDEEIKDFLREKDKRYE